MAQDTLLPITFQPNALVRSHIELRDTLIEDRPQVSVHRAAPPPKIQIRSNVRSPMSDDFPTPRANLNHVSPLTDRDTSASSSSDSESDQSSLWSKRSSRSDYDEMYDLSECEVEEVPIKLSSSVKRRVAKRVSRSRYPSIIIPSPAHWPTIEKLNSTTALSPPLKVSISPTMLSKLQDRTNRLPGASATPSLDGSLTSEELAVSSCPSTPDIQQQSDDEDLWQAPIQLDPAAINLLEHMHGDARNDEIQQVIEVRPEAEMREVGETPPVTGRFRLRTQDLAPPDPAESEDVLSALSVPSPGGFFASLDAAARKNWAGTGCTPTTSTATEFYGLPFNRGHSTELPTSTAASFYGVPWLERPENPIEQVIAVASPSSPQEPVTARRLVTSPTEMVPEVDEIDETYGETLKQTAAATLDRTQTWLFAQTAYMQSICEEEEVVNSFESVADAVPKTPDQASLNDSSPTSVYSSPSKKSVRFVEGTAEEPEKTTTERRRISPIHDGTFWEGWRHNKKANRAQDVFRHRQARAEAEQVKRTSLQSQHADQLLGKYKVTSTERPSPQRPISSFLHSETDDETKEIIQQAERERQALQQMESSYWHVDAQREVNGGKLLTSPIVQTFRGRKDVAILDIAGQVYCSWAWSVAHEHPDAAVYTTVSSDAEAHVAESSLEGPNNHFVVASPKLWELPFEDNSFDVVSARNLYTHLKTTWPKGETSDEWDLVLRDCLRVLKPGGYLEFNLMDAELVHPESSALALGVEFAFNLKTRSYDPCSGKSFLPRLKRAGFANIKRAWMVLPVADAVPRWVDSGKPSNGLRLFTPSTERGDSSPADFIEAGTPGAPSAPVTGSTKDVRAMTGLVGGRMWEQWMLKLNSEMGRSEKRCLDEVAKALEEGGKTAAGWRCLVGWAKKDA